MSSSSPAVDPRTPSSDAVEAVRLISGPMTRLDQWVDRLNPIFVKETRQAVKSKQFVIAFLLMLVVSWLISLIAVAAAGQQLDFGDWGRDLFSCYFVVLAGAILVVVPFTAFRSLMVERDDATYEPLVISTLTPRQIVFGKLQSALLQTFLYYSAIAPFMAFTALLQGFDIAHVLLLLGFGFGASASASVTALAISAMVKGRTAQTMVSLFVLGGLLFGFANAWGWAFFTQWLDWSDPETLVGIVIWIVVCVSNIVLCQQVAVANLTFQADNRSSGLRLIVEGQFVLIWLCVAGAYLWIGSASYRSEYMLIAVFLGMMLWGIAGLFFTTEANELSRRVVRQLPRNGLVRLLCSPFFPGGSRGLVLTLGNLLACGVGLALISNDAGWGLLDEEVAFPLAGGLYLVIYLNLATAMSRWLMGWSPAIGPVHCRVGTLALVALSMTLPMFLMVFDSYSYRDFSLLFVVSPAMTLDHIDRTRNEIVTILTTLTVVALLTTAINFPAIARGLYEMVDADPERRVRE